MEITRTSRWSGKTRTIDLPITDEQWADYESGTHVQYAMPNLTSGQREFIISGTTDEEWNEMLGPDDSKDN